MLNKLIKSLINLFHETIPRGQILPDFPTTSKTVQNLFLTVGNVLVGIFAFVGALIVCDIFDPKSLLYFLLTSISAFNKQSDYLKKFNAVIDNSYKITLFQDGTYQWYKQGFDLMAVIVSCYYIIQVILFENRFIGQSVRLMFTYLLAIQGYSSYNYSEMARLEEKMVGKDVCHIQKLSKNYCL